MELLSLLTYVHFHLKGGILKCERYFRRITKKKKKKKKTILISDNLGNHPFNLLLETQQPYGTFQFLPMGGDFLLC